MYQGLCYNGNEQSRRISGISQMSVSSRSLQLVTYFCSAGSTALWDYFPYLQAPWYMPRILSCDCIWQFWCDNRHGQACLFCCLLLIVLLHSYWLSFEQKYVLLHSHWSLRSTATALRRREKFNKVFEWGYLTGLGTHESLISYHKVWVESTVDT